MEFDPNEGVQEAIAQNFVMPFPIRRQNVAENIAENMQKEEKLVELHRFQGNLCLMGLAKSIIAEKKGVKEIHRVFFIFHPYLQATNTVLMQLISTYPQTFRTFFVGADPTNEKMFRSAIKAMGKKDPKGRMGNFLLDLKGFPEENIAEISITEYGLFQGLFLQMVSAEGNAWTCSYDGNPMTDMYEDKYGIKFCSELCKQRYWFLVYNRIKRIFDVQMLGLLKNINVPKGSTTKRETLIDTEPLWHPNICVLCGHPTNFGSEEMETVDHQYVHVDEKGQFTFTTRHHLQWGVGVCKVCREIVPRISAGPKGVQYRPRGEELNGIKLAEITHNANFFVSKSGFINITTANKFLMWHFVAMCSFIANPASLQNFLIKVGSIDPKSAFDWLEHFYLKGWSQLYAEMLANRAQDADKIMEVLGGAEEGLK